MEKYKNLESKIKSMTAKEIILSMVESLKDPVTKIDMGTFGIIEYGVCYGCAATNLICRLGGFKPVEELVEFKSRPRYRSGSDIIAAFEDCIDDLRNGDINQYNTVAEAFGFATISKPSNLKLPYIDNDNYQDKKVLQAYIDLANAQESEVK